MIYNTPDFIVEVGKFARGFDKFVGKNERRELYKRLMSCPEAGDVIPKSGSLRKLRWLRPGMGKQGGVRIIYYFYNEQKRLYLIDIFAKNEKSDLSSNDIKAFRATVQQLKCGG